jgi:hypothetical protein
VAATLADESSARRPPAPGTGETYYRHWLNTLEGWWRPKAIDRRRRTLSRGLGPAADRTPHASRSS